MRRAMTQAEITEYTGTEIYAAALRIAREVDRVSELLTETSGLVIPSDADNVINVFDEAIHELKMIGMENNRGALQDALNMLNGIEQDREHEAERLAMQGW